MVNFDEKFSSDTLLRLRKLCDPNVRSNQKASGFNISTKILGGPSEATNQNALIQELKTELKTVTDDLEKLRAGCVKVETKYRETTVLASQELKKSMNILFKLQMRTTSLEESQKENTKLSRNITYEK